MARKRKPKTKLGDKECMREDDDPKRERSSNDPAWYATDASLLRDAASIPFSWAVGTDLNLGAGAYGNVGDYVIPGLQVLYTVPSIGNASYYSSPINVAATATYSFVRHANSGHANYDSPDLMVYLAGMTQVYSYITFLQRAYGMAMLYAQRNRYLPEALLEAQFIDASDVQAHLADFRYGINVLINKAASLAVPATMPVFKRQAFLYSGIYTEGTSIKDQLYMYAPAGFWQYSPSTDPDGASALKMVAYAKNPGDTTEGVANLANFAADATFTRYKVADLLEFGNNLLNPILQSEDMNIMSGDILKAYGSSALISLAPLDTYYPVVPIFDIGVLEQIKNATVVPNKGPNNVNFSFSGFDVVQDQSKGWLVSRPQLLYTGVSNAWTAATAANWNQTATYQAHLALLENKLLTTTTAEVTPELVIESSRMMLAAESGIPANNKAYITLFSGSEIAIGCFFFKFSYASGVQTLVKQHTAYVRSMKFADSSVSDAIAAFESALVWHGFAENFRFHPECHMVNSYWNGAEIVFKDMGLSFDVDNYAVLTGQDIQRMHEAALMNMYHVPSIAKLN